jgi:hypothetical protein
MKAQDAHIQFILMTGVSKFSKVSLFSGVNQIVDITLDERYATICGYTQHDLETTFADHLAGVDWAKLKAWYNGYNFLGDSVYNPYDVLLFIDKNKDYRSYWAETGGTSFLFKLFRENPFFIPDLDNIEADEQLLSSFDINHIKAETLLFQTGYLTIDSRRINFNEETIYKLRTPNKEVSIALHDQFIESYCDPEIARYKKRQQETLYYILMKGDLPALEQELKRLFASIPWKNFTNSRLPDYEGYYASVIYAFFATMKMPRITAEDITNHGQADITFEIDGVIYILEIKVDTTKSYRKKKINPALKQIQDRGYRQKYIGLGMPVFEIGMIFNQTVRNLVQMDWRQVT